MKTDTMKQIKWLATLDDARLVKEGAEAMFAMSRHKDAEKYRGIQQLCLEMMVRTGHATVEHHVVASIERPFFLDPYGTFWDGEKFAQFDEATAEPVLRDVYVIDCGEGLRFKLPLLSKDVAGRAVTGTPESLSLVRQTSSNSRLTIAAQTRCVQLLILRLQDQLGKGTQVRENVASAIE